jgi:hypothetical protein
VHVLLHESEQVGYLPELESEPFFVELSRVSGSRGQMKYNFSVQVCVVWCWVAKLGSDSLMCEVGAKL